MLKKTVDEVEIYFQTKSATKLDMKDFDVRDLLRRPKGKRMVVDDEVDYFLIGNPGEGIDDEIDY